MQTDYSLVMVGNPILKKIATPIADDEFGSAQLNELAEILLAHMLTFGSVGLAAPQLGISKRIIAVGVGEHNKRRRSFVIPNRVIINPVIHFQEDTMEEDYEACLSINDLAAKVPRYRRTLLTGFDPEGEAFQEEIEGYHARILQHEIDHLDGILFLERVLDKTSFTCFDELKQRSQA